MTYLDIARSPIQIHVQVFNLPEFAKEFLQVLFAGFFVHVCDEDDPAFNGADGDGVGRGAGFGGGSSGGCGDGFGGSGGVYVHGFGVGHGLVERTGEIDSWVGL